MASWKARALFHASDPGKRAAKAAIIKRHLPQGDVFIVQETHGTREDVLVDFAEYLSEFDFDFSDGPRAKGGMLTFVRKVGKDGLPLVT